MTQTPIVKAIPLKRKGAGLNQLIAKTHKLGGQLLGLQITNGNLIAIFFSAIQITAGIVVFAWISMSGWALLLVPVCAPLALLIERLSLGGLMVFRTAGKEKVTLEDEYHVGHLEKDATAKEKYEYGRRLKRLLKDRKMSFGLIMLGVGISGYVGDQFWQVIFRPVGEPNSTALSILIAGSVSLTFVFSELYAELSNKGIRDAMMDNQISKAVLANAEEDLQLELSMEAFGNLRSDPAKRASVVNKIESGLTIRLENFADRAEYLLTEPGQEPKLLAGSVVPLQIVEAKQNGVSQTSGTSEVRSIEEVSEDVAVEGQTGAEVPRISRKRRDYKVIHTAFDEFMLENPEATLEELMEQFSIKQTTASQWRADLRKQMGVSEGDKVVSSEETNVDKTELVGVEVEVVPDPMNEEPVTVEAEAMPESTTDQEATPEPVTVEAEATPEPVTVEAEATPEPVTVEAEATPEPTTDQESTLEPVHVEENTLPHEAEPIVSTPEVQRTTRKRKDYKAIHTAFDIYIRANPASTMEEILGQFPIKQATANQWLTDLRKQMEVDESDNGSSQGEPTDEPNTGELEAVSVEDLVFNQ